MNPVWIVVILVATIVGTLAAMWFIIPKAIEKGINLQGFL